ncbi:unnamed protein product [Caenorhabditis angaria]|uniref:Uncharacterized protein n=1 Tax=Caenorhabditis angaria TaxID=860376 RepID=A0A9P1IY10_9PELO|nr:unnamed protein product [Caenorhabditis angaria]
MARCKTSRGNRKLQIRIRRGYHILQGCEVHRKRFQVNIAKIPQLETRIDWNYGEFREQRILIGGEFDEDDMNLIDGNRSEFSILYRGLSKATIEELKNSFNNAEKWMSFRNENDNVEKFREKRDRLFDDYFYKLLEGINDQSSNSLNSKQKSKLRFRENFVIEEGAKENDPDLKVRKMEIEEKNNGIIFVKEISTMWGQILNISKHLLTIDDEA